MATGADDGGQGEAGVGEAGVSGSDNPARTILVVDSNDDTRGSVERALRDAGMTVVCARDGQTALGLASEMPGVIILSVELSDGSASDVHGALKSDPRTARIPMLHVSTRLPGEGGRADGMAAADTYLVHPIDPSVLVANVRSLLRITDYETERAELLRHAEAARIEAVTANRAKSEFLATMSHELRTPLNAVLGYSQLLDMGVLGPITEPQHAHLERMRSSSVHLLALVNDVLSLAKIDAGRLQMAIEPESIHEAVEAALALVRPQAIERNIAVVDGCAPSREQFYFGDANRVRQILTNLLTNGVKFTDPGGRVAITCGVADSVPPGTALDGNGPWAFASVLDTGIGIGPESLERMFDAFVQEESGHTRQRGGTGLGLAISRSFARLMHGDVTVQSELGRGSTFTLWLPTPRPSDAAASTEPGVTGTATTDPLLAATSRTRGGAPILSDSAAEEMKAIGRAFAGEADEVTTRYVRALRTESVIPHGHDVTDTHLRDHVSTFLMELATTLTELGALRERAAALLRDGSDLQRTIAELHGAQRYRLGWSESDMNRDMKVLADEVLASVERIAPREQAQGDGYRYAMDLLRTLAARGANNSLRAYRAAAAADAR